MRRAALALLGLVALALPAQAQRARVVTSCGPTAYLTAGQPAEITVDTQGRLCFVGIATVDTSALATAANQTSPLAPVAPATATATKSVLLGAQTTTGAVNPTNAQQGALSSDTNNNLLVSAGGAPNLATSQASVTTGNISVASARALRRAITITNVTGTSAIYCGNTGVTTSTGAYLGATAGSSITLNTTVAVFCTVASTTQTVTAAETY